jgi:metal-dependent amidase/aminoacylase/carboxypeptidase family protein
MGLVSITDFALRDIIHARIRANLDHLVAAMGATYDLIYTFDNPPLYNDPTLVRRITPVAARVVGPDRIITFQSPYPFAHEDLALFAKRLPAALLWLGTANRDHGIDSILHTPDYDIDESAMITGVSVAVSILRHLLDEDGPSV